ncbi:Uncharacterised protein [Streptococcus pneumoniae]|jgi:hypothetical protein|nr:Uncharacterised protein [Streptococcus pneumoniae]CJH88157.1 Uncharacterised protein [Streptococcus pneumoniae]CJK49806.1 Uncharacterised protein [Streptococcus pneumoniae]COJ95104.1 Uncharacterised protein [Streptococcus pneumoniae]COQ39358.1 Uncharacterised protein [Streptococcus pneumoniae]
MYTLSLLVGGLLLIGFVISMICIDQAEKEEAI